MSERKMSNQEYAEAANAIPLYALRRHRKYDLGCTQVPHQRRTAHLDSLEPEG